MAEKPGLEAINSPTLLSTIQTLKTLALGELPAPDVRGYEAGRSDFPTA